MKHELKISLDEDDSLEDLEMYLKVRYMRQALTDIRMLVRNWYKHDGLDLIAKEDIAEHIKDSINTIIYDNNLEELT